MSTQTFFQIFPQGLPADQNSNKGTGLKDPSGNSMNLFGIFPMSLTILCKTFIHKVWVCDKINDVIIGADFINTHHLQYDTLSCSKHFCKLPHAPVLTLQEAMHFLIHWLQQKLQQNLMGINIASIFSDLDSLLQRGPAIIALSADGLCTITIHNCTSYPIELPRGSVIAFIEQEGQLSDINQMTKNKIK